LRFAQGRRAAADFLRSNLDLANEVEEEVREYTRQNKLAAAAGMEYEAEEGEDGVLGAGPEGDFPEP
jgi:hypothetical protein